MCGSWLVNELVAYLLGWLSLFNFAFLLSLLFIGLEVFNITSLDVNIFKFLSLFVCLLISHFWGFIPSSFPD